jgi:hypothetical protein
LDRPSAGRRPILLSVDGALRTDKPGAAHTTPSFSLNAMMPSFLAKEMVAVHFDACELVEA